MKPKTEQEFWEQLSTKRGQFEFDCCYLIRHKKTEDCPLESCGIMIDILFPDRMEHWQQLVMSAADNIVLFDDVDPDECQRVRLRLCETLGLTVEEAK